MSVDMWGKLTLQMFIVSAFRLKCNICNNHSDFEAMAASFAASQADRLGWTVDEACQVSCPRCNLGREVQGAE